MNDLDSLYRAEHRTLWALCYRLTGVAAEAEDLVQDAFVRALERPPSDVSHGLGGWLVRVATNLALDQLRRRKAAAYAGPWLPTPVDTDAGVAARSADDDPDRTDPAGRYALRESTSYAFLVALEALDPRQRAVLILRDVLDYSAAEVGTMLELSAENVRVVHHRARRAMDAYDAHRCLPTPELQARTRTALERFMDCLVREDVRGLEALLSEGVRTITDAGGRYTALPAPLVGRDAVARLYLTAARQRVQGDLHVEVRSINGLPALLLQLGRPVRRQAPQSVLRCDLDGDGRIADLHAILAPEKLSGLRFSGA